MLSDDEDVVKSIALDFGNIAYQFYLNTRKIFTKHEGMFRLFYT